MSKLDNDMISLARTILKSLDHFQKELVRQGEHIKHLTNRVKHVEMAIQHHDHQITDNRNSIKFLGNMLGVLLSDLNRYLLLYESILSELDNFWMHWTTCPTTNCHTQWCLLKSCRF